MAAGPSFEWDEVKSRVNHDKDGVAFELAQLAFLDERRVIAEDLSHSRDERRFYCFGLVQGGVMTVRFTVARGSNPYFRGRLLAQGQKTL